LTCCYVAERLLIRKECFESFGREFILWLVTHWIVVSQENLALLGTASGGLPSRDTLILVGLPLTFDCFSNFDRHKDFFCYGNAHQTEEKQVLSKYSYQIQWSSPLGLNSIAEADILWMKNLITIGLRMGYAETPEYKRQDGRGEEI
jgi:hypothetical protein